MAAESLYSTWLSEYEEILQRYINEKTKSLSLLEKEAYGLTSYSVAGKLTQRWNLPADISQAILLQSAVDKALTGMLPMDLSESTLNLLSILTLAKQISPSYLSLWNYPDGEPYQPQALGCLELSESDFADIQEDTLEELSII
ncbi:MAG: HDOD domain-containing protein [Cellvibrionaceae bacterium]